MELRIAILVLLWPTIRSGAGIVKVPITFDYSKYLKQLPSKQDVKTAVGISKVIVSAYGSAAKTGGFNLDALAREGSLQKAIDKFYGSVFQVPGYTSDIKPHVDAALTFADAISALDKVLREPVEIYADYDSGSSAPHFTKDGTVLVGDGKVHFLAGTTGASEVSGLQATLNELIQSESAATVKLPSVRELLGPAMDGELLPLNAAGNSWLVSELESLEAVFSYSNSSNFRDISPMPPPPPSGSGPPSMRFFVAGDFKDSTHNLQDIKGADFSFDISISGGKPSAGDTVTLSLSKSGLKANTTVPGAAAAVEISLETEGHEITKLDSMQSLLKSRPTFLKGGALGNSELAVFPDFEDMHYQSGGRQFALVKLVMTMADSSTGGKYEYSFDPSASVDKAMIV